MKKLISFLICMLIFVNVTSGISISADNVQSDAQYEEAAQLFNALGIEYFTDDIWTGDATRGDFLCMLMETMDLTRDIEKKHHSFKDVEEGSVLDRIIGYAQQIGLVCESASFRPYDAITRTEAYKLCVIAAGYEAEADMCGGYPTGYTVQATRLELNRNLTPTGTFLSTGEALILMKNFGDTPIRRQIVYGMTNKYLVDENSTVFSVYRNIYKIEGIVTANEYSSIYSENSYMKSGRIAIDQKSYLANDEEFLLGSYVNGYYLANDDENAIVFLSTAESVIEHIDSRCVDSVENGKIKFTDKSGKKQSRILSDTLTVIYNGKAYNQYTADDFIFNNGELILIDNNQNSIYDTVHIKENVVMLANKTDTSEKMIFDSSELTVDLSDADTLYKIIYEGSEIDIYDLPQKSLLNVFASKNRDYFEIIVSGEIISGVITEIGNEEIRIDEQWYEYDNYFAENYLATLSPGKYVTVTLDMYGRAAVLSASDTNNLEYGYVVRFAKESGFDLPKIKLLTSDNDFLIFDIPDKVQVNGEKMNRDYIINTIFENGAALPKLIRYALSSDGKLAKLETTKPETGVLSDGEEGLKLFIPTAASVMYRSGGLFEGMFIGNSSNTVFICASSDETLSDEERFCVKNPFSSTTNYSTANMEIYNVTDTRVAGAIVYKAYSPKTSLSYDSVGGLVVSVSTVLLNGDELIKICIFENGVFNDYYISDSAILEDIPKADENDLYPLNSGDYIRYNTGRDGKTIIKLEKDFSSNEKKILKYNTGIQTKLRYYYGKVYSMQGNYAVLNLADANGAFDMTDEAGRVVVQIGTSAISVFDSFNERAEQGSKSDLITYKEAGDHCSTVLIRSINNYYDSMVIYR